MKPIVDNKFDNWWESNNLVFLNLLLSLDVLFTVDLYIEKTKLIVELTKRSWIYKIIDKMQLKHINLLFF